MKMHNGRVTAIRVASLVWIPERRDPTENSGVTSYALRIWK
jgi:hypothetical protein